MRQESRKLAFCGMTAALAATLLTLGGIVPLATYACPLLAMLALVPVTAEYGAPAGLAAYAAAALLSLLLTPDKEIACLFLSSVTTPPCGPDSTGSAPGCFARWQSWRWRRSRSPPRMRCCCSSFRRTRSGRSSPGWDAGCSPP